MSRQTSIRSNTWKTYIHTYSIKKGNGKTIYWKIICANYCWQRCIIIISTFLCLKSVLLSFILCLLQISIIQNNFQDAKEESDSVSVTFVKNFVACWALQKERKSQSKKNETCAFALIISFCNQRVMNFLTWLSC